MYRVPGTAVRDRVPRYPSDTNRAEWRLLQRLLPVPACQTRRGGRPEVHDRRAVVDALRYLVSNGCRWRALPSDFPPWSTCYGFFERWARAGVLVHILGQLRQRIRANGGRCVNAVAVVIDSQSVKGAETVGKSTRGYDGAKKINGRKRAVVCDLGGLPLMVMVLPADRQDRDLARDLLFRLRIVYPQVSIVWADSAFGGGLVDWARRFLGLTIRVVSRPARTTGFLVLPRRWVVERTFSWLLNSRRHARDYERMPQHSEALLVLSAITLMTRRLARSTRASPPHAVA